MAGHRNKLRRIRLASMQLAGWSFIPLKDCWLVRGPRGDEWTEKNKERAAAFAENYMVQQGLLKGRFFNGYR